MTTTRILDKDDYHRLEAALEGLCDQARAESVFLVDRNGQVLATAGEAGGIDGTALGSLAAGAMAATTGIAALAAETRFSSVYLEGEQRHVYLSALDEESVLVLLFGQRSSVGLVRLRLRQVRKNLESLLESVREQDEDTEQSILDDGFFLSIDDGDIDRLFGELDGGDS